MQSKNFRIQKWAISFVMLLQWGQIVSGQELSPLEMKQDLDYLVSELKVRHARPFHSISEAKFEEELQHVLEDLPTLDKMDFIERVATLTALIGDGHTGLFLPWARGFDFSTLPIEFYHDDSGYFIFSAMGPYRQHVGKRLLKVGGVDVKSVLDKLVPLLPKDNEYGIMSFAGTYLRLFELMEHFGFTVPGKNEILLTVQEGTGEIQDIVLQPLGEQSKAEWFYLYDKEDLPLYLRGKDEQYWYELRSDGSMYVQFNSADIGQGADEMKFREFVDRLVTNIEAKKAKRLIIDLRWNSGGSFVRTRPLLWGVLASPRINEKGRLFTIIGPDTFSAATALAVELGMHTQTIFVGEPTGGKPNSFGDLGRILLPHSQIEVWYSRWEMHQSLRGDHRPAIFPEIRAGLNLADYQSNIDPALKAIDAYEPKKSISEVIEEIIMTQGVAKALDRYWELRKNEFNHYDFQESELNGLGYTLLRQDYVNEALEIFKLNARIFPYSPNSFDSLGDAYRSLGNFFAAVECYEKAFRMDKQYSHSRNKAQAILQQAKGVKQE